MFATLCCFLCGAVSSDDVVLDAVMSIKGTRLADWTVQLQADVLAELRYGIVLIFVSDDYSTHMAVRFRNVIVREVSRNLRQPELLRLRIIVSRLDREHALVAQRQLRSTFNVFAV